MNARPVVRAATAADAPAIWSLLRDFAAFLKLESAVTGTAAMLAANLASDPPIVEALVAEIDGAVQGYALYFPIYSSFRARQALFLEDLFVAEAARGRGLAKAMVARLATITIERNLERMEWQTGRSNVASNALYRGIDAIVDDDVVVYRLRGRALEVMAGKDSM